MEGPDDPKEEFDVGSFVSFGANGQVAEFYGYILLKDADTRRYGLVLLDRVKPDELTDPNEPRELRWTCRRLSCSFDEVVSAISVFTCPDGLPDITGKVEHRPEMKVAMARAALAAAAGERTKDGKAIKAYKPEPFQEAFIVYKYMSPSGLRELPKLMERAIWGQTRPEVGVDFQIEDLPPDAPEANVYVPPPDDLNDCIYRNDAAKPVSGQVLDFMKKYEPIWLSSLMLCSVDARGHKLDIEKRQSALVFVLEELDDGARYRVRNSDGTYSNLRRDQLINNFDMTEALKVLSTYGNNVLAAIASDPIYNKNLIMYEEEFFEVCDRFFKLLNTINVYCDHDEWEDVDLCVFKKSLKQIPRLPYGPIAAFLFKYLCEVRHTYFKRKAKTEAAGLKRGNVSQAVLLSEGVQQKKSTKAAKTLTAKEKKGGGKGEKRPHTILDSDIGRDAFADVQYTGDEHQKLKRKRKGA